MTDGDPRTIVRDGYDLVSEAYRGANFDYETSEYRQFLQWLPELAADARVLDLGCGCGVPVARELAERCQVTGVDISPVQISRARELVPNAAFILGDMTELEFGPASFDGVVALYSIIHVPVKEQPPLLTRIATWLRPGGFLLASLGSKAWTGTEEDWLGVPRGRMYWSHADAASYRRWLAEAGLRVEREGFVAEGSGGHAVFLCRKT